LKYYILVGEASGDLHGSNLMKALYHEDPEADIRFWGGDLMQEVGGTLVTHYKERAFMGFLFLLTIQALIYVLPNGQKHKGITHIIISVRRCGPHVPVVSKPLKKQ